MIERRLRSIPPRTTLDALREQEGRRGWIRLEKDFSGSSMSIGRLPSKESSQRSLEQNSGGFNVEDHVFRKPTEEKPNKLLIIPEVERITWKVEVHEDYDTQKNLGVILQFSGIKFTNAPVFERSRVNYGQDSSVLFSRIEYENRLAFLILATYGDIFESQVVATKIDVKPFFRGEIYLPQLTVTHNPTSMTVYEKNRLVIVNYNRL